MFTLAKKTINQCKLAIADKENRLQEDVSDAEVFEYINDVQQADEMGSIIVPYRGAPMEDWEYREPRTKGEILDDLVGYGNDYQYLAHI